MLYIDNPGTDPRFNLALEEHVFQASGHDAVLILWRNEASVIIGRYQNAAEQIDALAVNELGVNVVRRITGGGAVYHDLGNLNYTFITSVQNPAQLDFRAIALPVVKALRQLGVKAEFLGRNDILLDGRKISGTAQCCRKDRLLLHGTLLFDSNLDALERVLRVSDEKITSKGIQSIASRVTNIRPYLHGGCDIVEFKDLLVKLIHEERPLAYHAISEAEHAASQLLAAKKYAAREWNYGESPPANYKNSGKFPCGTVCVRLAIEGGVIASCSLSGDFLGNGDIRPLEKALYGVPYEPEDVAGALGGFDTVFLFGGLSSPELLSLFFR